MMLHHCIPTKIMEAVDITVETTVSASGEDMVLNAKKIGEVAVVVG